MTEAITQSSSNGHIKSTSQEQASISPPPEIEATLSRLSAYKNVRGVMILSRGSSSRLPSDAGTNGRGGSGGGIIQSTGSVFEGETGRRYAKDVEAIVESVSKAVREWDEGDELKFMRIRTKRHEVIITPDEKYLLVVLQDPGS